MRDSFLVMKLGILGRVNNQMNEQAISERPNSNKLEKDSIDNCRCSTNDWIAHAISIDWTSLVCYVVETHSLSWATLLIQPSQKWHSEAE